MADARATIAAEQAVWLAALQSGGASLDAGTGSFPVLAALLAAKRWRGVQGAFPATTAALGAAAADWFRRYATACPAPPPAGAVADGAGFVTWLLEQDVAPRGARRELVAMRLRWSWRGPLLRPRRGVRLALCWRGSCPVLGLALPFSWGSLVVGDRAP